MKPFLDSERNNIDRLIDLSKEVLIWIKEMWWCTDNINSTQSINPTIWKSLLSSTSRGALMFSQWRLTYTLTFGIMQNVTKPSFETKCVPRIEWKRHQTYNSLILFSVLLQCLYLTCHDRNSSQSLAVKYKCRWLHMYVLGLEWGAPT